MKDEPLPKRESYTGWIVGVCVLLLVAASVPVAFELYDSKATLLDLQGDPGGMIVWHFNSGLTKQTGVTNLPVKLVFHAKRMEFIARRTNHYSGPLELNVSVDGHFIGGATTWTNYGVRFYRTGSGWTARPTP